VERRVVRSRTLRSGYENPAREFAGAIACGESMTGTRTIEKLFVGGVALAGAWPERRIECV
jgi:hypothetical protein